MTSKNYFINGITELLILSVLNDGESYVYDVTKQISQLSGGLLNISQNTVYTATYKLENDGLISEYSKLVGRKRTRVYYHLEENGKIYLKQLLISFATTAEGVKTLLSILNTTDSLVDVPDYPDSQRKEVVKPATTTDTADILKKLTGGSQSLDSAAE